MRSWHWPTPGPRQKDRNWEREEDLPRLDRSPLAHTDIEKSVSARELVRIRITCSGQVPRYGPSDRRPGAPTGERLRTFLHSDESGTAPSDVDGYPEVRGSAGVTSRAGEGIRTLDVQLGKLAA